MMENKNYKPIIAAICCKNEGEYLKEWVEYHLNLGFDKIIVGDNNDLTGETYDTLLQDYIKAGKVRIDNRRGAPRQQVAFYNKIKSTENYEWCAFIDCDEFLTFNPESGFSNIKDFLYSRPDIKYYYVNWMCIGDNGHIFKTEGTVPERFPEPLPNTFCFNYNFPENKHIKSIIHKSVGGRFMANPHSTKTGVPYSPNGIRTKRDFFAPIDHSVLYLRHFYTKSLEEWVNNKMKRTGGNNAKWQYNLGHYFKYNEYTPEKAEYLKTKGIEYKNE